METRTPPRPLKWIGNKVFGKDDNREVPNSELGRFTVGVFGQNMSVGLVMSFMFLYCVSVLYIDPWIVGLVLGMFRIFDAFTDFVGGAILDKHVFKNGDKFRPILKHIALPVGALALFMFLGIGYQGAGKNNMPAFIILMVAYFIYSALYTFQDISQWAMCAVASTKSEERARLAQWGRTGGMIGQQPKELVPIFMGVFVLQHRLIFGIAGIVLGLGGMLLSRYCAHPKERVRAVPLRGNVFEPIKLMLKNKVVVLVVLSQIAGALTLSLSQLLFFQYLVNFNFFGRQIDGINSNVIFGTMVYLPSMFGILFTAKLSKKLGGMKNILVFLIFMDIVPRLVAFAFVRNLASFNTWWGVVVVSFCLMVGGCLGQVNGVAQTTLWGDSLDRIEHKTGKRNDASVFAMQNFVAKLGLALSTFFAGLTLTLLKFNNEEVDGVIRGLMDNGMSQVEATRYAVDELGILSSTFRTYAYPVFILAPVLGSLFKLVPLLFLRYNSAEQKQIELQLKAKKASLITEMATDAVLTCAKETACNQEKVLTETMNAGEDFNGAISYLKDSGLIGENDITLVCRRTPSLFVFLLFGALWHAVTMKLSPSYLISANENSITAFKLNKKTGGYSGEHTVLNKDKITKALFNLSGISIKHKETYWADEDRTYEVTTKYSALKRFNKQSQKEAIHKLDSLIRKHYTPTAL
ncbi:MAG: MFS transporter [Firmicutes bacterium]|nr:MFS transporter [Bacillota bacterium]